ncbi:hypothetical protein QE408_000004 [Agrobacterium larrymoorei]|uniref:Uncharacterized protein n=2 Tax=Agrobacterium larrymoorei TaxID=160699 RepID=A0ABU0UD70_9HYPH|nr:hypothetical protein [Agrobacterium larrymoorei]
MTSLTGDTDVFSSAAASGPPKASVMFVAYRQDDLPGIYAEHHRKAVLSVLHELADEGWTLALRKVFDPASNNDPMGIDTGFTHDHDIAGVFEAPSLEVAIEGTIRLEKAGWARAFRTEWLMGVKEFAPVMGDGAISDHAWVFLALWEWNDQWCEATPSERTEYDFECDIAFKGDLAHKVNIAGRHRMDWSHRWHHLGAWEVAHPDIADSAIRGHEVVADFKFTTSRHIVGRLTPLSDLLATRFL